MRITYVGHATLLIELSGTRVLTDPNFDSRLGGFLPRVSAPGVPLDRLPPLDVVLISHAHADHLSFASLAALGRDVPIYAPPAVARRLHRRGFERATPITPGETISVQQVRIATAAARHTGARYGINRWRGEGAANMYLIDDESAACLFAGDTALTPTANRLVDDQLRRRGRTLDVSLLPIGYGPWWKRAILRRGHLTPIDALILFEILGARYFIPYHWGTFRHLTSGAFDAIEQLRVCLEHYRWRDAVQILEPGASFTLHSAN